MVKLVQSLAAAVLALACAIPTPSKAEVVGAAQASSGEYTRPGTLTFERKTPTADQLDWRSRRLPANGSPLVPQVATAPPAERDGMKVWRLRFVDATGDTVPVLLALPTKAKPPFPLAVAMHAIYCDKAQVIGQMGPALTANGFAVLAPDLPCHGERAGSVLQLLNPTDAGAVADLKRRAVIGVRQCIDWAEERPAEIDVRGGVHIVGYSLGAWVACFTAEHERRISSMALCLAGSPTPRVLAAAPRFAPLDAAAALGRFHGTVWMANARNDQLIPRPWTERLFDGANRPKTLTWYDSGHFDLPRAAVMEAVEFVARQRAEGDPRHGGVVSEGAAR